MEATLTVTMAIMMMMMTITMMMCIGRSWRWRKKLWWSQWWWWRYIYNGGVYLFVVYVWHKKVTPSWIVDDDDIYIMVECICLSCMYDTKKWPPVGRSLLHFISRHFSKKPINRRNYVSPISRHFLSFLLFLDTFSLVSTTPPLYIYRHHQQWTGGHFFVSYIHDTLHHYIYISSLSSRKLPNFRKYWSQVVRNTVRSFGQIQFTMSAKYSKRRSDPDFVTEE